MIPKQIGWSQTSNLLYQLQRKLVGKNGNVPQEIGWSTEDKLIQQIVEGVACAPCQPATTSPTTTAA